MAIIMAYPVFVTDDSPMMIHPSETFTFRTDENTLTGNMIHYDTSFEYGSTFGTVIHKFLTHRSTEHNYVNID